MVAYAYTDVAALNTYLADKSYISGFQASQDDLDVFVAVGAAPDAASAPNAARWYSHVAALLAKAFPGTPAGVTTQGGAAKGGDKKADKGGKKEQKKEQPKKDKKKEQPAKKEKKEPTAEEKRAKQIKDAKKEGGKKAVDIAGAAEMTLGMEFFCTTLDKSEGDVELLQMAMEAMNVKVDENAEDRKGGSGHIGKMIFSANVDNLAVVAHVPEELKAKVDCKEWVESVVAFINEPESTEILPGLCATKGAFNIKGKKGVTFPIKLKDQGLAGAFTFLRSKNAFPESESDDDYVFGDDYGM